MEVRKGKPHSRYIVEIIEGGLCLIRYEAIHNISKEEMKKNAELISEAFYKKNKISQAENHPYVRTSKNKL